MKKLALIVLVCLVVPLQHGALGQSLAPVHRLAYDWCYPGIWEAGYWESRCQLFTVEGDTTEIEEPLQIGFGSSPTWSFDGLRIAFVSESGDLFALHRLDDSYVNLTNDGGGAESPRWSPDGRHIAFIRSGMTMASEWKSDLYVMNADGSNRTRLTNDGGFGGLFAWAPTGASIAFARNADGSQELHSVNADGSNLTRLTYGGGFSGSFEWAPTGATIAFARTADGAQELHVVNPDGSNLTRLTYGAGFSGPFAWAPTGATIAFSQQADGSRELHRVNADGSNLKRLTYGAGFAGSFSWAPDGARIAFKCDITTSLSAPGVCAVNSDGTNSVRLTADDVRASAPMYAPAGGRIAFVAAASGLTVIQTDGTVVQVAPGISTVNWSPDGESLVFVKAGVFAGGACNADGSPCGPPDEIYVAKADGTGLRMVGYGNNPAWFVPMPGQPAATFTYQCTGLVCRFDASGSFDPDGTIASYEWKFGDGTTGSGSAPAHTYATGATYDVTLIVTDQQGARDVTRRRLNTNVPPVASFTVACNGGTCTFDGSGSADSDGTINQYVWSFGDGNYGGYDASPIITHTYATGTYTASLSVTDSGGRESTPRQQTLTVVNALPVASFTITCTGLTCAYDASASSDSDGTIDWFSWSFGDGSYLRARVGSYTYAAAGSYTVTLTVADVANQTSTASQTVKVVVPPPPPRRPPCTSVISTARARHCRNRGTRP
jgi:Tol biopolymer transport system component